MAPKNKSKSVGGSASRRTLPTRGAKTAAIAGLSKVKEVENTPAIEDEALADEVNRVATEALSVPVPETVITKYIPQGPEKIEPISTTFKTTAKLANGLCIVRQVGVGKFEIINLSTVPDGTLGSEEVGAMIANNSTLANMIDISQQEWNNARVKCQQGLMSARKFFAVQGWLIALRGTNFVGGEIFRFFKLPLEMRNMIYKICLVSPKKLSTSSTAKNGGLINLALLRTSRAVYEEAAPVFQKNTFVIDYFISQSLKTMSEGGINANIRILEVSLNGTYQKDSEMFAFVQACKSLKQLKVTYTRLIQVPWRHRARVQHLYPQETELSKFRALNGFDVLCSLRGLEKVQIVLEAPPINITNKITEDERVKFEEFLMTKVTRPPKTDKEIAAEEKAARDEKKKLERAKKIKASRIKSRRSKNRVTLDPDDSEDEYDGTSRSWAH